MRATRAFGLLTETVSSPACAKRKLDLILQICSTAPRTSRHDLATQKHMSADVRRFGSEADICIAQADVG